MAETLPTRLGTVPRAPTEDQPKPTGPDDHVLSVPAPSPHRDQGRRVTRLVDAKGETIVSAWGHATWAPEAMIVDGQVVTHLITVAGVPDPKRAAVRLSYGDDSYVVVSAAAANTKGFTVYRCVEAP